MNEQFVNGEAMKNLPASDVLAVLIQAVNDLAAMIRTGPVWENKVLADRRQTEAEEILIDVITKQIEQEATA